jgi:hypothetical protein
MSPLVLSFVATMPSLAWRHSERVWPVDTSRVVVEVAGVPDGELDPDYVAAALSQAFDTWAAVDACLLLPEVEVVVSTEPPTGYEVDDRNVVSLLDIADQVDTVPASTRHSSTGTIQYHLDGNYYDDLAEADAVLNSEEVDWTDLATAASGGCADAYVLEATLLRQSGYMLGLWPTCPSNDCTEAEQAAALVAGIGPCDVERAVPQADDIAGIRALYGPRGRVLARSSIPEDEYWRAGFAVGGAPFEACLESEVNDRVQRVRWDLGDGETSDEEAPCHTWASPGAYDVTATLESFLPGCDSTASFHVAVCGPHAASDGGSLIDVQQQGAHSIQVQTRLDHPDAMCVTAVRWEVWEGAALRAVSAQEAPQLTLPGPGEYTLRLFVDGPIDSVTEETSVVLGSTTKEEGGGCSTLSAASGAGLLGSLLGLARRRRSAST